MAVAVALQRALRQLHAQRGGSLSVVHLRRVSRRCIAKKLQAIKIKNASGNIIIQR
jgi:hypothetical protein